MLGIIIDNLSADYNEVGASWVDLTPPVLASCYANSARAHAAGAGEAYAEFEFTGLTAGVPYRTGLTWAGDASVGATNATWEIIDSDGTTVLATGTVDQRRSPNDFADDNWVWKKLAWNVTPTGTTLYIRLTNDADNWIIADAAWIQLASDTQPADIVVGTRCIGLTLVGSWTQDQTAGFQTSSYFVAAGAGEATADFEFPVDSGVEHIVGITWIEQSNRATNVPYRILDTDGTTVLASGVINQELAPSGYTAQGRNWLLLNGGNAIIPTGTTFSVEITNNANEYVIADATIAVIQLNVLIAGTLSVTGLRPTEIDLATTAAMNGSDTYTYQLQRAPDVAGSSGTFVDVGSPQSGLTWTDTGLTTLTPYWWRVVVDDGVTTATSNEVTATPQNAPTGDCEWILDGTSAISSTVLAGSALANAYDNDESTAFISNAAFNGWLGIDLGATVEAELTKILFKPEPQFAYTINEFTKVDWADTSAGAWTEIGAFRSHFPFRTPYNIYPYTPGIARRCWRIRNEPDLLRCAELRFQGNWAVGLRWRPSRPIITPTAGRFNAGKLISIASSTTNADIYYTVGTNTPPADPDNTDTLYTGAISLPPIASGDTYYIKAIAYLSFGTEPYSGVTLGTFNPKEFVPDSGVVHPTYGNEPQPWLDDEGFLIEAHGGDWLFDPETNKTYWYGAYGSVINSTGLMVYSNVDDVYNWHFESFTPKYVSLVGEGGAYQTRYHPIYNPSPVDPSRKYVVVFHLTGFSNDYAVFGKSATAAGPFEWIAPGQRPQLPDLSFAQVLDCSVFNDPNDGKCYYVAQAFGTAWATAVIAAFELDSTTDYTTFTNSYITVLPPVNRENPNIIYYKGYYTLLCGGTPYNGNDSGMQYLSSTTLAGLETASLETTIWATVPSLGEVAKSAQSTAAIKIPSRDGYLILFDRWVPNATVIDLYDARYAPWFINDATFSGGVLAMPSPDIWQLDVELPTGDREADIAVSYSGATSEFLFVAAGVSAADLIDTFDGVAGTRISFHVSDSNHLWRIITAFDDLFLSGTGSIYSTESSGTSIIVLSNRVPASVNQYTEITHREHSHLNQGYAALLRASTTDGTHNTLTAYDIFRVEGSIVIGKYVNGVYSVLASTASAPGFDDGNILRAITIGTNPVEIRAEVNSIQYLSYSDSSSPISVAGVPGIRYYSDEAGSPTTGHHIGYVFSSDLIAYNAAIVTTHSGATGTASFTSAAPGFNSAIAALHSGATGVITSTFAPVGEFTSSITVSHSGTTFSGSGTTSLPTFISDVAVTHSGALSTFNLSFTAAGEFGFDVAVIFPVAVFVGDVEVEFPANYVDTIYSDVCFDYIISEAEIIV